MADFDTFSGGAKKDLKGKLPYHLITKQMMDALAEGLQLGLEKGYGANNWRGGIPIQLSIAAALRHIFKYQSGEDMNVEKGANGEDVETHHLCCALTNIGMAITQIKLGRTDLDDRYNKEYKSKKEDKEFMKSMADKLNLILKGVKGG